MTQALQGSLFGDSGPAELGPLGAVRRTELGDGAWIDVLPGWLSGSGELFSRLAAQVPWQEERRQMYDRVVAVPRLLCFYGEDAPLPDPVLTSAREALSAHYAASLGEPFRTAGLCYYRDGRDSVAWHGDNLGRGRREDTMVAILSVGSPASWPYAPAAAANPTATPGPRRPDHHGRLLPTHLGTRDPQDGQGVGPRISIQFRPRGVR